MSFKENTVYPAATGHLMDLLAEIYRLCPRFESIMHNAQNYDAAMNELKNMLFQEIENRPNVKIFLEDDQNKELFNRLEFSDYALIRLWDYINFADKDLHLNGEDNSLIQSRVFRLLWLLDRENKVLIHRDFLEDLKALFYQFKLNKKSPAPDYGRLQSWMNRHSSGLDTEIIALREQNKERIINILIREISSKIKPGSKYYLPPEWSHQEKYQQVESWWSDYRFHLRFAVRNPDLLNEYLDFSLSENEISLFKKASEKGIPFFINPYYLSLILVRPPEKLKYADRGIRDYIFYSKELVNEFGQIQAWEKEDLVEAGKPNAAGWLLPNSHNIHRRYPEVAIFIPDSMGRACAGLCVSCQRMYDFQRGNLNFKLDKLRPKGSWPEKLRKLMDYFEFDSQIKDILITGGDSLMSSNKSLAQVLDAIYEMAVRKKENNKQRPEGQKYAEIQRIRLGTRIPAYLPQRIDDSLVEMLSQFKEKAEKIGIKEFVIQVHFESAMELSPEAIMGIAKLHQSGWLIVNQQVFTAAVSLRGYSSKLRQILNQNGVIPYYTFTVKGFLENKHNFTPNARIVQEIMEEKIFGKIKNEIDIKESFMKANNRAAFLNDLMKREQLPFLSTDRNVFNLPALGKSMSFRCVGITADGRRILMFHYDMDRHHSPAVRTSEPVFIVESKSIASYLRQLETMGENKDDYQDVYAYSMALSEKRSEIFEYPENDNHITKEYTHFQMKEDL